MALQSSSLPGQRRKAAVAVEELDKKLKLDQGVYIDLS